MATKTNKVIGKEQVILNKTIGMYLNKLTPEKPLEEQLDTFLNDIGIPEYEKMFRQAFVVASKLKKIKSTILLIKLHELYPNDSENMIELSLKSTFKKWIEEFYSDLDSFPHLSYISLFKAFANKLN